MQHGTNSAYVNGGCRCALCKAASKQYRESRKMKDGSSPIVKPEVFNPLVAAAIDFDENLTDDQIRDRIKKRKSIAEITITSVLKGESPSMIFSGPAGMGKTSLVESVIKRLDLAEKHVHWIKGTCSATGLYRSFYDFSNCGDTTIVDDADIIYHDEEALNQIKSATDSVDKRRMSWAKETRMMDQDGGDIPREFIMNGGVIFLTNVDFDIEVQRNNRMVKHFEAMIERAHYINMGVQSLRSRLLAVEFEIKDEHLFEKLGFNIQAENIILNYMKENGTKLRSVSLRMAVKLANLRKRHSENWQDHAQISCFKVGP